MATSGTTIKQYTVEDLLKMSLRKLVVISSGQTPTTQQYNDGIDAFNLLIGEYKLDNLQLWKRMSSVLPLVAGTQTYTIGVGQTVNIPYPTKLLQMVRSDSDGGGKIDMDILAKYDFNTLPGNSDGVPISCTYTPQVNKGVISVWPIPSTEATSYVFTMHYQAPLEIITAKEETIDFPEEWYSPLVYGVAVKLAPEYGVPLADRLALEKEETRLREKLIGYGTEDGSFFIFPDRRR